MGEVCRRSHWRRYGARGHLYNRFEDIRERPFLTILQAHADSDLVESLDLIDCIRNLLDVSPVLCLDLSSVIPERMADQDDQASR